MFNRERTEVLVLDKEEREEADRTFIVFSPRLGKMKVLAKGERKILSKLRKGVDLFYWSEIGILEGRINQILTSVELKKDFSGLVEDGDRFQIAYRTTRALADLVPYNCPHPELFFLVKSNLEKLTQAGEGNYGRHYYYFLWRLFAELGYTPVVFHCVRCQAKLPPKNLYFRPDLGGVLCPDCAEEENDSGFLIYPNTIKIIRLVLDNQEKIFSQLSISPKTEQNLEKITQSYLNFLRVQN